MAPVRFRSLGSGAQIGANCYEVGIGGQTVIIDCGLHPKLEGPEALPQLDAIDRPPEAILVSHAHIDHCGAVPKLLQRFYETHCFATEPTVAVMDRMLHNSVSVMGTIALEQGVKGYPLYQHRDVDQVIRRTYGLRYGKEFQAAPGMPLTVRFISSGHVLGSASVLLKTPGHTLYYTSDVCRNDQELLGGLELPDGETVDTLIIETTRGAQEDADQYTYRGEARRLAKAITEVLERGGVALVPSFALGRTQEMLNVLSRLMERGDIPEVPMYASGLGRAVYELYSKFPHYLKQEAVLRPLANYRRIGDVWERSVRRELVREPSIIVATSGMMIENTPSAMIASELVREERHGIFFVGYLDPDTLGYKLLHAQKGDELIFETSGHPVAMELENRQRFHFSAHAPREDLLWLIGQIAPRNIVLVHGDDDAVNWMRAQLNGSANTLIPHGSRELVLPD